MQGYSVVNQPEQYLLSNVGTTTPLCNRFVYLFVCFFVCVCSAFECWNHNTPLQQVDPCKTFQILTIVSPLPLNLILNWVNFSGSRVSVPVNRSSVCSTRTTWCMWGGAPGAALVISSSSLSSLSFSL